MLEACRILIRALGKRLALSGFTFLPPTFEH
jgi:hypothetical protein